MAIDTHLGYSEPILVGTYAPNQNGLVYPMAPVFESTQFKLVRVSLYLQALSVATGVMNVEVCLQFPDDATTWPTSTTTPTSLATAVSKQSEGVAGPSTFEDITALLTKKYFRFVFFVKNTGANTGPATCLAALRVERKSS